MPVIDDTPCRRVAGAHMRKSGRNQHVILGAQIVQLTELQRVGEWLGGLSTLPPSRPLYMPQSAMDNTELRADCLYNTLGCYRECSGERTPRWTHARP